MDKKSDKQMRNLLGHYYPMPLLVSFYIYKKYKKKGGLRNWLNEMKNSNVDYSAIKIIDKFGINK